MYVVYILASNSRRLYIGMSGQFEERIYQHKAKLADGFTKRYNIDRLVYFESHDRVENAILREKVLKKWRREKKIRLIESVNPKWEDLSDSLG